MPLSREGRADTPELRKELDTLSKRLQNADKIIGEIKVCLDTGMRENANDKIFRLEDTVEKAANFSRNIPAYTGKENAFSDTCAIIEEANDAYMEYTKEDWFHMRLPVLLPKKEKGNAKYIRTVVFSVLDRYFQTYQHEKYREPVVLIYDHVYNEAIPETKFRDHDNIELNAVTDMVAMYCLIDDSPLYCKHYYTSRKGKLSFTDVYIVPLKDFTEWLKKQPAVE